MQGARVAIHNKSCFWVKLTALMSLISFSALATAETVHPGKLSSTELAGYAFKNPNTIVTDTPTVWQAETTSVFHFVFFFPRPAI